MKLFSIGISLIALSVVGVSKLSSEPFKYKYEITGNSKSANDIYNLYEYKEKLIDIYDEHFLALNDTEREKKLINNNQLFKIDENCRAYYASGTIVVLVGDGKGLTITGDLRYDTCDETVIRTKIYIFDIFN